MSSLRQKEANRRNALKSTGPITFEGKHRSRCNAIRHGLTSETVVTAFEDVEDYEAFQSSVISDYDAETAVQRELVLRLASVLWRLRRSTLIETGLFETAARPDKQHSQRLRDPAGQPLMNEADDPGANETGLGMKTDVAHCFLRLADLPSKAHVRLSHYEQALWRQARQLVITLNSLRHYSRRRNFPFSFRGRDQTGEAQDVKKFIDECDR